MFKIKKQGLKYLKILHLLAASCWLGGAVSLAVLNLHNANADSNGMLYGINSAGHSIDMWVVITFGAVSCALTGLIYSVFTVWGFKRHGWIIAKWLITITAILSGTFLLGEWELYMLESSRIHGLEALQNQEFISVKFRHLCGGIIQILALASIFYLSVFRPKNKKREVKGKF